MDFFGLLNTIFDTFMLRTAMNLLFVVIYVASLVYVVKNKNKIACQTIVLPIVFMFVTLFNPVVYNIVMQISSVSSIYGRFFWTCTIFIVDAIALATVVSGQQKRGVGILAFLFCVALVVAGGGTKIWYAEDENIYKIPQYVIDMDEAICEAKSEENPTIISYEEVFYYIRQYDPTLLSYGNLGYITDTMKEQMGDEMYEQYGRAYEFLTAAQGYEVEMSAADVNKFITELELDFVCSRSERMKDMDLPDYFVDCIYAVDGRYVYSIERK